MVTVTRKNTVITFHSIRDYAIYEARGCIREGMPYEMYVGYIKQWDRDGTLGYIFDVDSYNKITAEITAKLVYLRR